MGCTHQNQIHELWLTTLKCYLIAPLTGVRGSNSVSIMLLQIQRTSLTFVQLRIGSLLIQGQHDVWSNFGLCFEIGLDLTLGKAWGLGLCLEKFYCRQVGGRMNTRTLQAYAIRWFNSCKWTFEIHEVQKY